MRWSLTLSACLAIAVASKIVDAGNFRGSSTECSPPPGVFQGTVSYSGLRPGARASYKCCSGCYMVGSSSISCSSMGVWSGSGPECRVHYDKRKDNTYKNRDKGYKLYSG